MIFITLLRSTGNLKIHVERLSLYIHHPSLWLINALVSGSTVGYRVFPLDILCPCHPLPPLLPLKGRFLNNSFFLLSVPLHHWGSKLVSSFQNNILASPDIESGCALDMHVPFSLVSLAVFWHPLILYWMESEVYLPSTRL